MSRQKPLEKISHDINVEVILKCLWAIRDNDQFYFNSYGKEMIENCIQQKLKKSEESEKENKWISVLERLPHATKQDGTENHVLIIDETIPERKAIASYSRKSGWAINGNTYWEPTHWMSIPDFNN